MSEWIRSSDSLPSHGDYCWLYGFKYDSSDLFVFEGRFDLDSHEYRSGRLIQGMGWEYDEDRSDYVMLDQISHWMPYFTPEPPK